ncbi:hypothetical protein [Phaffia rhodozyma]|uniref:Uncharacterized protein n=1 Tax=Phaffia rhodozyma TaxID=264483 RepID=A0A0F7SKV9_PHARH|nr:hypothetical protein [Phaffia rhodozyma]
MSFRVVWPFFGWERAVICELGLTKKETVERLRSALPDDLSRESVERMDFQIPVGEGWADVMDSDWDDLIIG